jgi:hypothetical protein
MIVRSSYKVSSLGILQGIKPVTHYKEVSNSLSAIIMVATNSLITIFWFAHKVNLL